MPCTIAHRDGKSLSTFPLLREEEKFKDKVQAKFDRAIADLEALRRRVEENTTGLSKAKAASLLGPIDHAIMQIRSNLPFVKNCFDEHVEQKIKTAKVEIHGYMARVMLRAGLSQLTASPLDPCPRRRRLGAMIRPSRLRPATEPDELIQVAGAGGEVALRVRRAKIIKEWEALRPRTPKGRPASSAATFSFKGARARSTPAA